MNTIEQKKLVEDKRFVIDLDQTFHGRTIDEVIDELVRLSIEMAGELHKFDTSIYTGELYLISYRFETDKEYERRLKNKEKAKEKKAQLKLKREESEKKKYERLRKKYGE